MARRGAVSSPRRCRQPWARPCSSSAWRSPPSPLSPYPRRSRQHPFRQRSGQRIAGAVPWVGLGGRRVLLRRPQRGRAAWTGCGQLLRREVTARRFRCITGRPCGWGCSLPPCAWRGLSWQLRPKLASSSPFTAAPSAILIAFVSLWAAATRPCHQIHRPCGRGGLGPCWFVSTSNGRGPKQETPASSARTPWGRRSHDTQARPWSM